MQSQTLMPPAPVQGWFSRAEAFLDQRGKPAWIAAMILGFILFWPLGLALLFYMIWRKDMFKACKKSRHAHMGGSTGNSAFDAYKADTLKRLEDEQRAFEGFLGSLREAKDKTEFDAFMKERDAKTGAPAPQAE